MLPVEHLLPCRISHFQIGISQKYFRRREEIRLRRSGRGFPMQRCACHIQMHRESIFNMKMQRVQVSRNYSRCIFDFSFSFQMCISISWNNKLHPKSKKRDDGRNERDAKVFQSSFTSISILSATKQHELWIRTEWRMFHICARNRRVHSTLKPSSPFAVEYQISLPTTMGEKTGIVFMRARMKSKNQLENLLFFTLLLVRTAQRKETISVNFSANFSIPIWFEDGLSSLSSLSPHLGRLGSPSRQRENVVIGQVKGLWTFCRSTYSDLPSFGSRIMRIWILGTVRASHLIHLISLLRACNLLIPYCTLGPTKRDTDVSSILPVLCRHHTTIANK